MCIRDRNKAIYEHAVYKKVDEAIEILWDAIAITHTNDKVWTEREIELLITIGSIYTEEDRKQEAIDVFQKVLDSLDQLVFISDNTIMPRLYYNLARVYGKLENYEKSIYYCKKGIKHCLLKDNLYPLGELHYQISYNYEQIGQIETALSYIDKAKIIFELIEDRNYLPMMREGRIKLLQAIEQQKETDHVM